MKPVMPASPGAAAASKWSRWLWTFLVGVLLACSNASGASMTNAVSAVPESVRREYDLDQFYQKHIGVFGLPIVSSEKTSDFALLEAAYILRQLLAGRENLASALVSKKVKVAIMAYNEFTTDLPEQRNMSPPVYWDARARGLGGRTCSGAEENLLGYPGDPYSTENILIHEFAHVIHGVGMRAIDPTFDPRLREAFQSATNRGLWKGTYAGSNRSEYWAEAVQSWFDNNRHDDALHNHVHTRSMLKEYDPQAARLCAEVFGENPWRYRKPMEREPAGRAHLSGFDPTQAPRFRWREPPIPEKPRVRIETALGQIELELDAKAAPITSSNFLRYVAQRLYNEGSFFRTVTAENQPDEPVKIAVIQAAGDPARTNEFLLSIPLERTSDTGLRHLDGTISMARDGPGTAQDNFFICIGDQPELDSGGKRKPDGQGFAAFGKVIKGMEIVRRIHQSPAEGQRLRPPIPIQRAVRLN
jgi:cyclophilin family peptidyl-prolyl cis-trans isomerase